MAERDVDNQDTQKLETGVTKSGSRRSWKGVGAADRTNERRELFLDAALDLLADREAAPISIRGVCAAVHLNVRYFYESFATVDDLLAAVYDRTAASLRVRMDAVLPSHIGDHAMSIRVGVEEVLRFIEEDPRRGRILFAGELSNATLALRRRATLAELASNVEFAARLGRPGAEAQRNPSGSVHENGGVDVDAAIVGAMFAGAMTQLVLAWIGGEIVGTPSEIANRVAAIVARPTANTTSR